MSINRRGLLVGASAIAGLASLPFVSSQATPLAAWFDREWFSRNWFYGGPVNVAITAREMAGEEPNGWVMSRLMIRSILGYVNGRVDPELEDLVDEFLVDYQGEPRHHLDVLSLIMFPESPPMPREESAALWKMFEARAHYLDVEPEHLFLALTETDGDGQYEDPIDVTRIGDLTVIADSEEGLCPRFYIGSTQLG